MQIICTQSGKKPFFGTWWNLTEGPNPLPHWSLFTLLLSTLESLVLPSLNNSTRFIFVFFCFCYTHPCHLLDIRSFKQVVV